MAQAKSDKKFLRTSAAWALLAGLAAAPQALAQTAETPAPQQPAASEAAQPESEEDAIVVTGSRLRQTEFSSPAPVQIISTERAELAGVSDVAEMLQSSTLASGSLQNDATISTAFVTEGGPGSQTISLRGLGANRTLVLVNGRRGGPAGTRGQVSAFDLNVLPLAVIDRFEILKDGASSVYGSDAVAGVVNIITRRDLDGGEVEFSTSQPFQAGGAQYGAEGVWGKTWDRGYFTASFDYYLQEELKVGARDYTRCREDYTFDATTGERSDRIDARTGRPTCRDILSGQVWLYEYSYSGAFADGGPFDSPNGEVLIQFDPTNEIGALLPQTILPPQVDGSNPTAPSQFAFLNQLDPSVAGVTNANPPELLESSLIPELERYTAFFQAGFDLASNTEAYAEVLLNRRKSRSNGVRQFWTYLLTYDYFYLDGSNAGDPFSEGWNGAAVLSPTPITDHFDAEQVVDYARVVAGLRGKFASALGDIDWDIYIQGSRSDAEYTQDVILDDAVRSAQFRNVFGLNIGNSIDRPGASCVGFNTPISNRPCVDVNWLDGGFLNGNPTAAERAFLFDRETGKTVYEQVYAEGSLSGDIFKLPAGNVGAVVGFHIRRDEIEDIPGHVTLAGNSWGLSTAGITAGDDSTSEAFGEIRLPIFRGQPLAEDVMLSLSGRYTDVDSYGSDSTYRIGLNWQMTPEFRVRATKGTSFRAPALFEQFLADQTSFASPRIDPCRNWGTAVATGLIPQRVADNCDADGIPSDHTGNITPEIITGGGDLNAETSDAWTVGVIWRPTFADLNIALDYFEIEINDEVRQLGAANILFGCYNSTLFPNEPLCDLFQRAGDSDPNAPDPFLLTTVTDRYINVATQINRGLDLTIRYGHDFSWGDLTLDGQFTYQLEDTVALVQGIGEDDNGEVGNPEFVGIVDLRLDRDDWTYSWRAEMIGETEDDLPDVIGTDRFKIGTEFTTYHSASIRYRYDQAELTLGVSNVFDEHPPALSIGGSATQGISALSSQYDYIGRRAFVRLRLTTGAQ